MLNYSTYINPNSDAYWVTFVHGAGGSSSIWYKQIRDFRKHFHILLIDLRGHGKSNQAIYEKIKNYSFEVIGDEVVAVLDELKIQSTHFIGISLGTIVIREITERFPERTKSMILGGAVMKLNFKGQILMKSALILQTIIPYLVLYKLLAFIIMPKKKNRESRHLFINEAKKLYKKEFKRWFTLISQVNPLLSFFRIKDSGIPTLYVMGSEDYMFLPSISKLVKNHTSSELLVIQNCGHVVNIEQPILFNKNVIEYLLQLPNKPK
jgi:pimeloyl-ACP methyl ester carboxylesterase